MDVPEPTTRREAGTGAADGQPDDLIPRSKRLPRKVQIGLVILLAALLLAGIAFNRGLPEQGAVKPGAEQTVQTGGGNAFKPTPQQWAGFVITPVKDVAFRPVQETDGKIAYDDDLTTPVFSPFTGRVIKVFARMGDRVQRGDPLAAIQATEFVQAQSDLITAWAALRTARAQLNLAQTNEKRQHALVLAQGGALKDWQQSQVDLSNAQGNADSAQIALGAVRNRLRILGKSDQEIETLQNAPGAVSFDPEVAIVAPIDGVVTQRQIGVGQNIVSQSSGGSAPLFSIGNLSKVWLVANVREADAPLIHVGDAVAVQVPAYPGRVFDGRVSYVAPAIDSSIHRLAVHAEVDNPDLALKPEMQAVFRITTGTAVISPAVPEGALIYEGDKVHVWLADPAGKTISLREIAIGQISGGMVQVLTGLQPQEQVVTAGSLFIDRAVTGE